MIRAIVLKQLRIPFKSAFRHAAAERAETSSLWVEVHAERGEIGYGESCPRDYVTGETFASAQQFFARHRAEWCDGIDDLASLQTWMAAHAAELDANPAAWCAVELAILDVLARRAGKTVEALLSLPPLAGRFAYTAVLGDADAATFRVALERYRAHGFTDFKIKLSGDLERDRAKIAALQDADAAPLRVRVDANNLWHSAAEASAFLQALDYPLFAVEEPVGAGRYADLARIAQTLGCRIVLDESFLRIAQLAELRDTAPVWLLNLRVSKLGGLLRTLRIVAAARAAGLQLVVGAQVGETSLLTRAALTVAHAAQDALTAQEGAFGTFLLAHDLYDPPLMFGVRGVLDIADHASLGNPGFGLEPRASAEDFRVLDAGAVDAGTPTAAPRQDG